MTNKCTSTDVFHYSTMRKEPHTLHGCCTLAVLANLFRKHGLVLKDSLLSDLFQKFCVPIDKATPILQVRY